MFERVDVLENVFHKKEIKLLRATIEITHTSTLLKRSEHFDTRRL